MAFFFEAACVIRSLLSSNGKFVAQCGFSVSVDVCVRVRVDLDRFTSP